ncbi:MAG: ferrous iron transporter B, partial [Planctomycetes bacterium]|nr:ferrous iron transporter B [Planctomycetota bacterium]
CFYPKGVAVFLPPGSACTITLRPLVGEAVTLQMAPEDPVQWKQAGGGEISLLKHAAAFQAPARAGLYWLAGPSGDAPRWRIPLVVMTRARLQPLSRNGGTRVTVEGTLIGDYRDPLQSSSKRVRKHRERYRPPRYFVRMTPGLMDLPVSRYARIAEIVARVVTRPETAPRSFSDRLDRVLTHRIVGTMVLAVLMAACFQSIYSWSAPLIDTIDGALGLLGTLVAQRMPEGPLQSMLVDGVIAGVGAVLIFLPQIVILFLFLAIIEDCGYMARAAFLLDRWMGMIGLSGKSFVPLLSSFACAIPGIMATRTIEDRNDRFVTILIAPLMSCSARLPVYMLLIAAFIPATPLLGGLVTSQVLVLFALYGVGTVVAILVALVLKRTVLKGESAPFLMELPKFKWPSTRTVLYRAYEQGREFMVSAGTIIFAVAIVIWALGYYPHSATIAQQYEAQRVEAHREHATQSGAGDKATAAPLAELNQELERRLTQIDREEAGAFLEQSVLGRMGRWIEPIVEPLGWDWRIGTAAIAAFPAREVVIATMGTIYNLGAEHDENSVGLRSKLQNATWPDGRPVFNIPVALSIMVFFALCCQCGATLAVIKRETRSWRWPLFTFVYMTTLAYVGAFITFQVASRWV